MAHEVSPHFIKNTKWALLIGLAFIFALAAVIWSSPLEIFLGLYLINISPSLLLTDYIAVAGLGAALFNSALVIAFELIIIKLVKSRLTGPLMAAVFLTSGFAFFGTNLLNSLPIFLGAFLFAKLAGRPMNSVLLQAFFTTALGPLVSILAFHIDLPLYFSLPLAFVVGVAAGLISPPLASSFLHFHQGYSLYNIGFVAGIMGMAAVALIRLFDRDIQSVSIISQDEAMHLTELLVVLFLLMMLFGLLLNGSTLKGYARLLRASGRLVTDFDTLYGSGLTIFNMGLLGLMALFYVFLTKAPMNGPVVGGILSVVGFGAMGKQPRNCLPILCGVFLATYISPIPQASTSAAIAALFATGMAPLAGEYGFIAGLIAGFLHTAMARNILIVHGGVNLYNNGFSTGFVAAILNPLYSFVRERKQLWQAERKRRRARR